MGKHFRRWMPIFIILLAGIASGKEYTWKNYGKWVDVTNNVALLNTAKKAAIDDQRPMLILYSKPGNDCAHCKALWQGALCDGVTSTNGGKCVGASCPMATTQHPWAAYAKQKKIILIYINVAQAGDWYTYLSMMFAHNFSGGFPVYALFHVKSTANLTSTEKATVLNTSNVDSLGVSYYSVGATINGVKLANTYDTFKALFESYFASGKNTYGLKLTPEADDSAETITIKETLSMEDFEKKSAQSGSITSSANPSVWYAFTAVSGKTYKFKLSRSSGSSNVKAGIYANTGTASTPNYDKTKALLSPATVTWDGTISWTSSTNGRVLLKIYSEATSPNVQFTTTYLALPSGNHLLNPDSSGSLKGNWYTSGYPKYPAVVAFINDDIWDADTLAMAKATQQTAFTQQYASAYWFRLTENQGNLTYETKPELVYVTSNGKVLGRVSDSDMQVFSQYMDLEKDAYDPENNTRDAIPAEHVIKNNKTIQNVKLGGVDAIDWYAFESTENNQRWTFTVSGNNASSVSMAITDGDGREVDGALADGNSISYMVPSKGTRLYVKLTTESNALFDYVLMAEIKMAYYTVQFGASDYTVVADADSIEIPVILNKINYQSGAITVSMELDHRMAFNQELFFLKGNYASSNTSVTWTSRENTNDNDYPKTKYVKIMLGDTEKEEWWSPGEKEKTVTVSLLSPDVEGVELSAENAVAVIHVRNVNNPVFVGENGNGSTTVSYETYVADQPSGDQTKTIANCISMPAKYAGNDVFWELIEGDVPNGVDIVIKKNPADATKYNLVISGTSTVSTETSAKLLFFVRKEKGKSQIMRCDEFTINFTIGKKMSVNGATRSGWNLVNIPWGAKLNEEQEQQFLNQNKGRIFLLENDSYGTLDNGALESGSAYWVFVPTRGEGSVLSGIKDETVDEGEEKAEKLQGKKWYFGTDPGVGVRKDGWYWNGSKYVYVKNGEATDGAAGWWFLE